MQTPLETLATIPPPSLAAAKLESPREFGLRVMARLNELETQLGLEKTKVGGFTEMQKKIGPYEKLVARLNGAPVATVAPPSANTVRILARSEAAAAPKQTLTLATLRDLELHVFGVRSVPSSGGDEAKQLQTLTRKFYEQNLEVPGLDYSALSGVMREPLHGSSRMKRGIHQTRVDKFFAQAVTVTPPSEGLTGRARFNAAVRLEK